MTSTHASVLLGRDTNEVAFCPVAPLQSLLAVGTYSLHKDTGGRDGCLHLMRVNATSPDEEDPASFTATLHEVARADHIDAVFDLKWAPAEHSAALAGDVDGSPAAMLAMAGTASEVSLHRCTADGMQCVAQASCESGLCTSVDWSHPGVGPGTLLATATSDGELVVLDAATPGALAPLVTVTSAHDLEIWTVAFDRWRPHVLYSGADDAMLKLWDVRLPGAAAATADHVDHEDDEATLTRRFADRRTHQAGVCCVVPSPWSPNCVVTGSYDEMSRVWDLRNLSRPTAVAEVPCGGGVWRLKWHPMHPGMLAAACMYGGFFLLRGAGDALDGLAVVEEYTGHDNTTIAYGVDWCHRDELTVPLLASCSFYEQRLNLWSPSTRTGDAHEGGAC